VHTLWLFETQQFGMARLAEEELDLNVVSFWRFEAFNRLWGRWLLAMTTGPTDLGSGLRPPLTLLHAAWPWSSLAGRRIGRRASAPCSGRARCFGANRGARRTWLIAGTVSRRTRLRSCCERSVRFSSLTAFIGCRGIRPLAIDHRLDRS
jgi:hypothetical protein